MTTKHFIGITVLALVTMGAAAWWSLGTDDPGPADLVTVQVTEDGPAAAPPPTPTTVAPARPLRTRDDPMLAAERQARMERALAARGRMAPTAIPTAPEATLRHGREVFDAGPATPFSDRALVEVLQHRVGRDLPPQVSTLLQMRRRGAQMDELLKFVHEGFPEDVTLRGWTERWLTNPEAAVQGSASIDKSEGAGR